MKFAVWSAVSSDAQAAADKVSLEEQVEKCRIAAAQRGWVEACPPFIVPGESRTRYVNLSDAEREIPPLRDMLEAAKRHQFDVLTLYDMNRLRDLLPMVTKSLDAYGVQMFSVSQPVEPSPPDNYNPYASDTAAIMSGMAAIISRTQIADLRRKYDYAMPKRASRGLPVQVPYGYIRVDRKHPPTVDLERAQYVIMAKDMLLAGRSLGEILAALNEAGAPTPSAVGKWYPQTLRAMLRNPFYAGVVRWRASRVEHDPRTGQTRRDRRIAPDRLITAPGQHVPLWDGATHQRILDELKRRGKNHPGKRRNQLSRLMYCGVCGSRLWVSYREYGKGQDHIIWFCSSGQPHPRIKHPDLLRLVGHSLRQMVASIPLEAQAAPSYQAELDELTTRRQRILDGYEAGAIPLQDYVERVAYLDSEIDRLAARQADTAAWQQEQAVRREAILSLRRDEAYIPGWVREGDMAEVNNVLRLLLDRIIYSPDGLVLVGK